MADESDKKYMNMLIAANFLGPLVSGILTYYMVRRSIGPEELYRIAKDAYDGARRSIRDLEYREKDRARKDI